MSVLIMILQLLASFSFLIFIHELGHYLAAKFFGMKVEKFFLFIDAFNFKLFSFKKGECEYGLGWIPIGGYVKIAGMIDESLDKASLKTEARSYEYRSRPAWQRLVVVAAGIMVNFTAAVLIFWLIILLNGQTVLPNDKIDGIVAGKIAQRLGFMTGDKIEKINGRAVKYFDEVRDSDILLGGTLVEVRRKNELKSICIPENFLTYLTEKKFTAQDFITPRLKFVVEGPVANTTAERLFRKGDKILSINNIKIDYIDELVSILGSLKSQRVEVQLVNNGELRKEYTTVSKDGKLFFTYRLLIPLESRRCGMLESFSLGIKKVYDVVSLNFGVLNKVIKGSLDPSRVLSGPIGLAKVYSGNFDWLNFWSLTAVVSLALAIMNSLPIPGLDGGHVLLLVVEILRGKPLSDKLLVRLQIIGMSLLLLLMVYIYANDVIKLFS